MFTLGMAGLIAAYVLIAILLLSINLYSNWSWQVKAGSIIITTAFYIVTYLSFPALLGWPTDDNPPGNFHLIAAHVQQPNKITGNDGSVFIWLTQIDDLTSDVAPRAYELPYSDALYEIIINANNKIKKGIPQLGEFKDPEQSLAGQIKDISGIGDKSVSIQFYDLPDPLFPEK